MKVFNRRRRLLGNNKSKYIVITIVGIGIAVTVGIVMIGKSKMNITLPKQDNLTNESQIPVEDEPLLMKNVIKIEKDLQPGDNVTEYTVIEVPVDAAPNDALTNIDDLKGKKVRRQIKKDEILLVTDVIEENLWFEPGDRYTEHTFIEGAIPTIYPASLVGSVVDILLFKPQEEDLVVVSKVAIVSASGARAGFNLSLEENELLKEAAAEGSLYLRVYLDEKQPSSIVTYSKLNKN